MRICLDCIPCFVRQSLDAARHATADEQIHEKVVRDVLEMAKDLDMSQSPPLIGQKIHRLIRKIVGVDDPYRKAKQRFNDAVLKMYDQMHNLITGSKDPLATAVRLAIAGNIIDFGVKSDLTEAELSDTINQCLSGEILDFRLEEFRRAINEADDILYLTDNAGEIVFDRLLIEQLPTEKITVAVKGSPVINDATMEDAEHVGLTGIVKVIDNGTDAPGTVLQSCSESFRDRFEKADMVISKGQGNYETLSDVNKNIFFILKVKCPMISKSVGCGVGEMILRRTEAFKRECEKVQV